jgi:hypothetical protein
MTEIHAVVKVPNGLDPHVYGEMFANHVKSAAGGENFTIVPGDGTVRVTWWPPSAADDALALVEEIIGTEYEVVQMVRGPTTPGQPNPLI